MKTRIGCLGLLLLWAIWGVYLQLTDRFGEEGGGRFAIMGFFGLAILVIGSTIESLTTRPPRQPPGFPVKPRQPKDGG